MVATIYFEEVQDFCDLKGFMFGKELIAEKNHVDLESLQASRLVSV